MEVKTASQRTSLGAGVCSLGKVITKEGVKYPSWLEIHILYEYIHYKPFQNFENLHIKAKTPRGGRRVARGKTL